MTLALTLVGGDRRSVGVVPAVVVGRFDGEIDPSLSVLLQAALEEKDYGRAALLAQRAGLNLGLSAPPTAQPVYEVPVDPSSLVECEACQ